MKYRTFRNLVGGGLVLFVAGGATAYMMLREPPEPPPPPVVITKVERPTPPPPVPSSAETRPAADVAAEPPGLRDVDRDMLRLVKTAHVQAKIKDATSGRAHKINLYSDDGRAWNRAKVDLDRDDKWDEKWTWKPSGDVERKVATKDDENYDETWILLPTGWQKK